MAPTRILSLQPYYGGSHQQFHDGWTAQSSFQWTTLTLPARHWKWRMRHASIYFAREVRRRVSAGESWDAIVCTDMLNVPEFKGLVGTSIHQLPLIIYFHENQFAYPIRSKRIRDQHFPFTNFVSALAADRVWFNSRFNYDTMHSGLADHARLWPDHRPSEAIASLSTKFEIQPPGIEQPPVDLPQAFEARTHRGKNKEPIRIVWAARWEHDKNPDGLLDSLNRVDRAGVDFELSVLGQSFRDSQPIFDKIHERFSDRIRRWGYESTRQQYWQALAESDVFVSTAKHEFFGLAAAEAIAVGLNPILPNRLAYPELISLAVEDRCQKQRCLFEGSPQDLCGAIEAVAAQRLSGDWQIKPDVAKNIGERLNWKRRGAEMDQSLQQAIDGHRR